MKNTLWLLPVIIFIVSCSGGQYTHEFSGSAILKDKFVATYAIKVDFESRKGVDEFIEHKDKITHAIRIILVQRNSDQLDKKSRMWSVTNKVLKSQLNEPIKKITIKSLIIEK